MSCLHGLRMAGVVALLGLLGSGALGAPDIATPAGAAPSLRRAQTAPRRPPVYLMGDSTMLIMWYHPDSQAIISEAYDHTPDFESCRTIIAPPCRGRFGYVPLNTIATMRANEGELGEVMVVMAGYDDSNIERGIDVVMEEARRQGVTAVLWFTYTTQTTYVGPGGNGFAAQYAEHNRDLYAATAEHPDLYVADWNTYSAPHRDWFSADGIHLTRTGAFALAAFIRAELDKLYAGQVGRCTSPEAIRDELPTAASLPAGGGGVTPVEPQRLLDTRNGTTMVDASYGVVVQVPAEVASGATAAWVNVTSTGPCRPGYLAAGSCATDPGTSTVNHSLLETRAGLALVPLDEDGRFCVRTYARSDVVIDLMAVQGDGGGHLSTTEPDRVVDTRAGALVAAGEPLAVDTGVPAGASGVFANLTVVGAEAPTYAAMFPATDDGTCAAADWNGTSNLNVPNGDAHANAVLVGVGGQGRVCVVTGAAAHVVVDRMGVVDGNGAGAPSPAAQRLLDTRLGGSRPAAGSVVAVPTGAEAAQTVLVNLTADGAAAPGYLAVVPTEGEGCATVNAPSTSTVNVAGGAPRANLALAQVGAAGQVCVFTYSAAHVVADLVAS